MTRSSGYSFIELLIALLVFSLGVLLVAALQLGSVQATRSASEAAAALLLVEDLFQRLLANPAAIERYGRADGSLLTADPEAVIGVDCLSGSPCAADAWARQDIALWLTLAERRGLPTPRACVMREAAGLVISLSWSALRGGAGLVDSLCGVADEGDRRRRVTLRAPLEPSP